ncbi:MAG: DUF2807 domain-containing protein [Myxococcales bacterium]|nr:DUF2807 domain-containing protein [Myxococcales bacterium]MCB9643272.1 DUF2807 domain-containing protein [Myxococcales bacterium]
MLYAIPSNILQKAKKSLQIIALGWIAFANFGCGPELVGTGPSTSRELNIQDVDRIIIHDSLNVDISLGDTYKSSIEGPINLLEFFRAEQEGSTLNLRLKYNAKILQGDLTFFITLPKLRELRVVDASKVQIKKLQTQGDLRLDFSGMSDIQIDADTDGFIDIEVAGNSVVKGQIRAKSVRWKLTGNSRSLTRIHADENELDASGGSWVNFVGECNSFRFVLAGGSKGFFDNFNLQTIQAELSGDSSGIIRHEGQLNALIEGNSTLFCIGNPQIGDLKTTGGGQLQYSN